MIWTVLFTAGVAALFILGLGTYYAAGKYNNHDDDPGPYLN